MKLLFLTLLFSNVYASVNQTADTFIVLIYDKKVKVLAPKKITRSTSVILENKSLSTITGKLFSMPKNFVRYVTLSPESTQSITLNTDHAQRFFFMPMAPAFQEVELLAGKKSYEIPPQE